MVVDDEAKERALWLLRRLNDAKRSRQLSADDLSDMEQEIKRACEFLHYHGDILVEVRFSELVFESIWRLQTDELVDRTLTPQTKASIRIVLGSIAEFAGEIRTDPGDDRVDAASQCAPSRVAGDEDEDHAESAVANAERDRILARVLAETQPRRSSVDNRRDEENRR